ncbi:MAG: hypothetical protein MUE30_15480 [Spirosomaceae bacterium]|jgi:hypothetical protein|nr:hypothetical protein [Spirosomataceae bacterium]
MNFKIESIATFDRQIKRLAKKYPSVKSDFDSFLKSLLQNPTQGTPLGKDCFKIRMAISSKKKLGNHAFKLFKAELDAILQFHQGPS